MSMWYELDVVLILNCSVCPTLTLIDIANPRIDGSSGAIGPPQSLWGSPGNVFSHATGLTTGGPHGPAAAAWAAGTSQTASTTPRSTSHFRGTRPPSWFIVGWLALRSIMVMAVLQCLSCRNNARSAEELAQTGP